MALVVPFALDENRHLIGIRKEYHTRKRKEQHVVYITVDRDRKYLLAYQRLAKTADYINENCIYHRQFQGKSSEFRRIVGSSG